MSKRTLEKILDEIYETRQLQQSLLNVVKLKRASVETTGNHVRCGVCWTSVRKEFNCCPGCGALLEWDHGKIYDTPDEHAPGETKSKALTAIGALLVGMLLMAAIRRK